MRYFLILLSVFATVAWGQVVAPLPDGQSVPTSIGKPHLCGAYYPLEAKRSGASGSILVAFAISTDGKPVGIVVAASSGYDELDDATVACVKEWLYKPAMQKEAPVEVPWSAIVVYELRGEPTVPAPSFAAGGMRSTCIRDYPVTAHQLEHKNGVTILTYKLVTGQASSVTVKHSSGDDTLDNRAVDCVKAWKFGPTMSDGQPATGEKTAKIDWKEALVK